MEKGELPPDGLKPRILKLAGRVPRPTNLEIEEEVYRDFGLRISERTIRRYCKAAGLPTSSRKAGQLDTVAEIRKEAPADNERHLEELTSLAARIRELLVVVDPMNATGWFKKFRPWWRLPGVSCLPIEGLTLTEVEQALIPYLRSHLPIEDFWQQVEPVNENALYYCYEMWSLVNWLVHHAFEATKLPVLDPGQTRMPGLTEAFFDEVLSLAAVHDSSGASMRTPYRLWGGSPDLRALAIGRARWRIIAWAPEQSHETIIDTHERLVSMVSGQAIESRWEQYAAVSRELEKLRSHLVVAAVRQRIAQSACDLCRQPP